MGECANRSRLFNQELPKGARALLLAFTVGGRMSTLVRKQKHRYLLPEPTLASWRSVVVPLGNSHRFEPLRLPFVFVEPPVCGYQLEFRDSSFAFRPRRRQQQSVTVSSSGCRQPQRKTKRGPGEEGGMWQDPFRRALSVSDLFSLPQANRAHGKSGAFVRYLPV